MLPFGELSAKRTEGDFEFLASNAAPLRLAAIVLIHLPQRGRIHP